MENIDKIKKLIAEQLGKSVDEITEDKEIVKDLGADSLDAVEMIMTMEEQFGVSISDDEGSKIKTVGDIVELIKSK